MESCRIRVTNFAKMAVESLSEQLIVVVVLLFILQIIITTFNRKNSLKFKAVDALPGPTGFLFLGPLHYLFRDMRDILNVMSNFVKKYGPIMKINLLGERYVFLNSAEYAQALLSSNDSGHLDKAAHIYDVSVRKVFGDGLVTSPVKIWRSHRKIISRAFAYKSLRNYVHALNKYSKVLIRNLKEDAVGSGDEIQNDLLAPGANESACQIHEFLSHCTINIISDVVMGFDSEFDTRHSSVLYGCIKRVKQITMKRERSPWLFLESIWKLHPLSQEYANVTKSIDEIIMKMIQQYKTSLIKKKLDHEDILELNDEDTEPFENMMDLLYNSGMSDADILTEVKTMIITGFETSSATLQYMLFNLALNQEHQRACRDEIDRIFENSTLCANGNLTFDALSQMKYTERCINETLRMFPVILCLVRKLTSPLKLDEKLELPSDTNVVVLPYIFHSNSEYFVNPETFNPDRFLLENSKLRHPYSFFPFSAGPRNCIGIRFGLAEIKTMMAHILRNFEVFTTDSLNDVPLLPSIVLTPKRDYNFIFKRRLNIFVDDE